MRYELPSTKNLVASLLFDEHEVLQVCRVLQVTNDIPNELDMAVVMVMVSGERANTM